MKKNTALLRYLIQEKCIVFSRKGFKTKWGETFPFETDIRPAYRTIQRARKISRMIYDLLEESVGASDFFLGVPETGTMMSFFLNEIHARSKGHDLPVNILRAKPKPYQGLTAYSVQPLSRKACVVLIEDDVVTGKTLLKYVRLLHTLGMKHVQVVSVIDRGRRDASDRTVQQLIQSRFGYSYRTLVTLDDIKKKIPQKVYAH